MELNGIEISSKIRYFVISQLFGFDQFANDDKLVDMGIVTDDFVFNLIQFIENDFNISIPENDFNLNNLSINSIGNYIEQKKNEKEKEVISTAR